MFQDLYLSLTPPHFWCDNVSAISLTSNMIFQSHTRHIEVDYHCVREKVIHKELEVDYISSKDQLADLLTKVPLFGFVTYSPSFPFFVACSACGA